ncbi:MAG: site-specific DNA-methyltransferase [Candidatus Bathyarchaeota archaeon]|nr:site-specific DNA-methyltransferase [Candidatus Termiticorpusculum sp.]
MMSKTIVISPVVETLNSPKCEIICGDTLFELAKLPSDTFYGVITDPPYSSGGPKIIDRIKPTADKYLSNKTNNPLPDFEGDARDQRSWTLWMTAWMREARRVCREGAVICIFTDWRQLPAATDAMQWSDWIWRGIVVWDKNEGVRPQLGRFRSQAEYVVWGSKGKLPLKRGVGVLPGVFKFTTKTANKKHQTEKPLDLMRRLCHIITPGGPILDPFVGSGSTLLAARLEGYPSLGIELTPVYSKVAHQRITQEYNQILQQQTTTAVTSKKEN